MKYRKLRIVWSIGCGLVCLLLIPLWMRSHRYYDVLAMIGQNSWLVVESVPGSFIISTAPAQHHEYYSRDIRPGWQSYAVTEFPEVGFRIPTYTGLGFVVHENYFQLAYFWPVSLCAIILGLIWVRPSRFILRFSLRTLLIAATVVAVGLGLIVWAAK